MLHGEFAYSKSLQLSGVYFMRAWLGGASCEIDIIYIEFLMNFIAVAL